MTRLAWCGGWRKAILREPQVMFFALLACGLIFVAQWPGLSRAATIDTSVTFEQRMGGAMFGIMFLLPLILYGCAAVLKLGLRLSGANVPGILVRLALFWSLLTVTPLMLLQGGLSAFFGVGSCVAGLRVCGLAGVPLHSGKDCCGGARSCDFAGLGEKHGPDLGFGHRADAGHVWSPRATRPPGSWT